MIQDRAVQGMQNLASQADDPASRIVVGLDGSPSSWDAFSRAAGEALRSKGKLIAVYAAARHARDIGVSVGFVSEYGDPTQTLTDIARTVHARLVVVVP
jgi:nucleotide-binding universal stress UspA family protein